jgi:hypothetical protein
VALVGALLLALGLLWFDAVRPLGADDFGTGQGPGVAVRAAAAEPDGGSEAVADAPSPPVSVGLVGGVTAPVRPVDVLPDGVLELPADPSEVGWWTGSSGPGGATGPMVLAGHVRTADGGYGALTALFEVQEGDVVEVARADGATVEYRIRSRLSYLKADLPPELFLAGGPHRLVLVTCTGDVDLDTGSYTRNIVVTAEPVG